jgi:hypothetical protein
MISPEASPFLEGPFFVFDISHVVPTIPWKQDKER